MTIRRRNPRLQGDIGLGAAIAHFLAAGYRVALPVGESQPWDLIVERPGGAPERVQVKTTTYRNPRGRFCVHLSTSGGNQSWSGLVRRWDPQVVEWLFVLTDDRSLYLIPSDAFEAELQLTLDDRFGPYRLDAGQLRLPL